MMHSKCSGCQVVLPPSRWSTSGWLRFKFGRAPADFAPEFAEFGPTSEELARIRSKLSPNIAEPGPKFVDVLPKLANFGQTRPILAKLGPTLAGIGRTWVTICQLWPIPATFCRFGDIWSTSVTFAPILGNFGPSSIGFDRIRPNLDNLLPVLGQLCSILAGIAQLWANIGAHSEKLHGPRSERLLTNLANLAGDGPRRQGELQTRVRQAGAPL